MTKKEWLSLSTKERVQLRRKYNSLWYRTLRAADEIDNILALYYDKAWIRFKDFVFAILVVLGCSINEINF